MSNVSVISLTASVPITFSGFNVKHSGGAGDLTGTLKGKGTTTVIFTWTGPLQENSYTVNVFDIERLDGVTFIGEDCDDDKVKDDFCWNFSVVRPEISFMIPAGTVGEGEGSVKLVVTSSPALSDPVSVAYETLDGDAIAGSDYITSSGTLTFEPGAITQTIAISIIDDGLIESAEDFQVVLTNTVEGTLGITKTATITIQDNDVPTVPTVSLSASSDEVEEGAKQLNLQAILDQPSPVTVTVSYETITGSATHPEDYEPFSGTITFPPNSVSQPLPISIVKDKKAEIPETFQVKLLNPVDATLGSPNSATVTIKGEPSVIELISFRAKADVNHIRLTWETGSEIDNVGFNLYRASSKEGPYTKINNRLIPAEGGLASGANYAYLDPEVTKGMTYYYRLEDLDIHSGSTFHDLTSGIAVLAEPSANYQIYFPFVAK